MDGWERDGLGWLGNESTGLDGVCLVNELM